MRKSSELILKTLKKIYQKVFAGSSCSYLVPEDLGLSPEQSSDVIFNLLSSDNSCMIARFGANEFCAIENYLAVKNGEHSVIRFIKGEQSQWWWNNKIIQQMQSNAGFFPSNPETISKFSKLMIDDVKELDLLALWFGCEKTMPLPENCKFIHLLMLEPYWSSNPWTRALKEKKVVVVHPFAELIEKQYKEHRTELFENPDVLPVFNLRTVKAVQSLGGEKNGFRDWFEALDWMKNEIDKEDYDVCLIGCGAYGFPLAAHCKRQGKKAVHMGGALQLLVGIKGKRWVEPDYCKKWHLEPDSFYIDMMSKKCWVRPDGYRTPKTEQVECGCYW